MKLIEKKCPNCGASLEFSDTDKSCKCQYCHRAFEIERDNSINVNDIAEQFNLSELKGTAGTAAKVLGGVFVGQYIIAALVGIVAIIIFVVVGINFYKSFSNSDSGDSDSDASSIIKNITKEKYFTSAEELDNEDFGDLDNKAYSAISKNDDSLTNFSLKMSPKRQKVYVAYNAEKNSNIIVAVYKARYNNFFANTDVYLYVPIKYENIKSNRALVFELDNPSIDAPEYYLDADHTEYTYGYGDMETLVNEVIEPLKKEYTVTEK